MATITLQMIKDQAEYDAVLERIIQLFNASLQTPEGNELSMLLLMVDTYQKQIFSLPEVDPTEVIKFMMNQRGLTLQDLAQEVGGEEVASQILSGQRKLTPQMIITLSATLHIPTQALL